MMDRKSGERLGGVREERGRGSEGGGSGRTMYSTDVIINAKRVNNRQPLCHIHVSRQLLGHNEPSYGTFPKYRPLFGGLICQLPFGSCELPSTTVVVAAAIQLPTPHLTLARGRRGCASSGDCSFRLRLATSANPRIKSGRHSGDTVRDFAEPSLREIASARRR